MATDLDGAPIYDPITKHDRDYISHEWLLWIESFVQTLSKYLTSRGIYIPQLTLAQRDAITSPQEGQMIYVTDIIVGPPRTAEIQVWQVKAGVGAWRTFTTTP